MDLKSLPDELKVRVFNQIVDAYKKDTNLSQFGSDVQDILRFLRELYK